MRISDWSSDVCSSDLDDMTAHSSIKKQAKHLPLTPGHPIKAAVARDSRADANVIDMAAMADPDVAREVVENGYEPPALEDYPSESANCNFPPAERETVLVQDTATDHQAKPATKQATKQTTEPGTQSSAPTYPAVAKSLRDATTLDALALAADLIRDVEYDTARNDLGQLSGTSRPE